MKTRREWGKSDSGQPQALRVPGGGMFPQEQCRSPEGLGLEVTGPDLPLRKLSCRLCVSLGPGWRWQVPVRGTGGLLWGSRHACSRAVLIGRKKGAEPGHD